MRLKLFLVTILMLISVLNVGCARIETWPVQEGRDIIWLEEGQLIKAPVRGAFKSDRFMQEVEGHKIKLVKCK